MSMLLTNFFDLNFLSPSRGKAPAKLQRILKNLISFLLLKRAQGEKKVKGDGSEVLELLD
jgi:hypothetical protein